MVHQLKADAFYGECVRDWYWSEASNEYDLEMDAKEEGDSWMGKEAKTGVSLFLHERRLPVCGKHDRMDPGDSSSIFGYGGQRAGGMGSPDSGSCFVTSCGGSSGPFERAAHSCGNDAGFDHLAISDDRCYGGETLQGPPLRPVGDLDAGELRATWRYGGWQFSSSNTYWPTECNTWVTKAWEEFAMSGVIKKAFELGMTPAPGPPVEGYVEKQFVDVQPEGEDEEYWYDLLHDVESQL